MVTFVLKGQGQANTAIENQSRGQAAATLPSARVA